MNSAAVLSVGINAVNLLLNSGSSQSIFSIINQFQLLLLFPLLQVFLSNRVIKFYKDLNWTLGSFDLINSERFESLPYFSDIKDHLSEEQENPYLLIIGISDKSSFINLTSILTVLLALILLNILLWFTLCLFKISKKSPKNCLFTVLKSTLANFTFNIYIRTLIES